MAITDLRAARNISSARRWASVRCPRPPHFGRNDSRTKLFPHLARERGWAAQNIVLEYGPRGQDHPGAGDAGIALPLALPVEAPAQKHPAPISSSIAQYLEAHTARQTGTTGLRVYTTLRLVCSARPNQGSAWTHAYDRRHGWRGQSRNNLCALIA